MSKRVGALLLTAALALTASCTAGPEPAADHPRQEAEAQASAAAPLASIENYQAEEDAFYTDVPEGSWYASYVRTMYELGVLPKEERFRPADTVTRLELVTGLYRLHLALGGQPGDSATPVFTDVAAGTEGCAAAAWARENGVTRGVSDTEFDPDGPVTRETACAFAILFSAAKGIRLPKVCEPELFPDSGSVKSYARSAVVACQMAGILNGQDGRVNPAGKLDRAGAAVILCRLYQALTRQAAPGEEYVSTDAGAYLELYERFDCPFGEPVPESEAVPVAWFKDAVFVGDSLTVGLQMYHKGALGDAMFLCTTSLSAPNALAAVTDKSLHPTWNGVKMKVEDAVAACGARYVYIMLGINNMRSAVSTSTASLAELIGKIQEKAPQAAIIVQSVTPLTASSNILSDTMNNPKIDQYNARMRELCAQRGWYYLDVASAVKDANGNFDPQFCGDAKGMGIHFSAKGAAYWAAYLQTHVPAPLK